MNKESLVQNIPGVIQGNMYSFPKNEEKLGTCGHLIGFHLFSWFGFSIIYT